MPEENKYDQFRVIEAKDRKDYPSGMNRGSAKGKTNYRLIDIDFLTRLADHMTKGAEIYGRDNWRKANSEEELERFLDSAERHLMQYLRGDMDEDHAMATVFNIMCAEYVKGRIAEKKVESTKAELVDRFSGLLMKCFNKDFYDVYVTYIAPRNFADIYVNTPSGKEVRYRVSTDELMSAQSLFEYAVNISGIIKEKFVDSQK